MATLINTKILLTLALIASRLIVVILYAFIFIILSFYALNIITILNFKALIFC